MAEKDDILELISAMRAETEESSLTPDRVGYLLQRMVQLLDGYADTVSVGVIRQEVDRALREVAALQAENLSQAEELTRLLGILTRLSNVVQVNGRQLDILSSRVSSNTDRIAALEDSRPDPSVGSVTDVKLDGHSVVNNNGVASLRTPGFLDIKGYVTIHHVMMQTLQDALNALNLYCTENEFDIEQLKARPNIIFGQMDGSTFYDLDDNAVTPDDNSLYIDISADKLHRWNGTAFVEVSGVGMTDVPFLENPNTSKPNVFGIYKSFADYYAWVGDHQTSHMMTVGELLDYLDKNIGKVVLLLDSASSPEYVQVLSVAGGIPSTTSSTNIVELSSYNNFYGLSISISIERSGTLTGYTVTAERKTDLRTSSYSGQTMVAETSISAAGVISKTASGVTKIFDLPAESGTLARKEETLPNKTYAPLEFSGLGRKYLQKNIVDVSGTDKNVLTQAMVSEANTEFVVQYDYDLNDPNGESPITIPANCALKFEGGSINNGKIVFQDTSLESCKECFGDDLVIEGKVLQEASPEWFTGSDADKIEKAINTFGVVQLAARDYLIDRTINVQHSFRLNGYGIPSNFGDYATPSKSSDYSSSRLIPIANIDSILSCVNPSGRYVSLVLSGVSFVRPTTEPWFNTYKNTTTNVTGFSFSTPNGPSRPAVIENCNFRSLKRGIHIFDYDPTLNRSTNISRLRITGCNISYNGTAIHIEGNNSVGGLHIEDNVIEQNAQAGIYANNEAGSYFENKGVLSGIIRIVSNLLEGQPNPLYATMTNGTLELKGNYYEDSNGTTVTIRGLGMVPSRQRLILDSTVMSSNIGTGLVYDLSRLTLIDNDNPNAASSLSLSNVIIQGTTTKKISGTRISYAPVEGNVPTPLLKIPITPTVIYHGQLAYRTRVASGEVYSAYLNQAMPAGNYNLRAIGKNLVFWLYNLTPNPSDIIVNEVEMNPTSLSENMLLEYRFTIDADIQSGSRIGVQPRTDSTFFSGFAIYADDGTGHDLISFDPMDFVTENIGEVQNPYVGFERYDKSLNKQVRIADVVDDKAVWKDLDGFMAALSRGTAVQRPTTLLGSSDIGFEYFDTDLCKDTAFSLIQRGRTLFSNSSGNTTVYLNNPCIEGGIISFLIDSAYTIQGNIELSFVKSDSDETDKIEVQGLLRYFNNGTRKNAKGFVDAPDPSIYKKIKYANKSSGYRILYGYDVMKTWVDEDNFTAAANRGATADRPTNLIPQVDSGFKFFDTTLNKELTAVAEVEQLNQTVATVSSGTTYVSNPFTDGEYTLSITTHGNSYFNIYMSDSDSAATETVVRNIVYNHTTYASVNVTITDAASFPYLKMVHSEPFSLTVKITGKKVLVWREDDGAAAGVLRSGATADRPASTDIYIGFQYFDTTDGKMIVWNGTAWVNLDGTALS